MTSGSVGVPTRPLGSTGLLVSQLGLGAWGIGGTHYGPVAREQAHAVVREYLDAGGNFVDTALVYGESEAILGEALRDRPDVVVVSKVPHTTSLADVPLIVRDLETTLSRLGRERIDVYLMHQPPREAAVRDAVLDVLEDLRDDGQITAIGASIAGPNVSQETVDHVDEYVATGRVQVVEVILSLLRPSLLQAIERCHDAGVGVIARTTLESGFLTGRYPSSHAFPETDHRSRWVPASRAAIDEAVASLSQISERAGLALTETALRFPLGTEAVSTTIVGATRPEHVRRNMQIGARGPLPHSLTRELQQWFAHHDAGNCNPRGRHG